MFKLFCLSLFLMWLQPVQSDKSTSVILANQRAQFITDFLNIQINSRQMFIHVCGNKDFQIQLSRTMSKGFYSHVFISSFEELETFRFSRRMVILLELGCIRSLEFLTKGSKLNLFTNSHNWILFSDFKARIPTDLYLPINSRVFVASQNLNGINVSAVFKYSYSDPAFSENDIGKWIPRQGFKYFRKLLLRYNRSDLMGAPLRALFYYNNIESLNHTTDFRQIETDNLLKINYILLTAIADYLNATFVPSFTPNFGLIFDEDTGMFEDDSMMGNLQRERADVIGANSWVEPHKLKLFRFFGPTTPDNILFLFRAPSVSLLQNVYLMPFNLTSWFFIGAVALIGVGILFIIVIQEKRYLNLSKNASIVDLVMTYLSALLQKTWDIHLKSYSGRLTLTVIYLSSLIIFNAYSASIIIFLQGTSDTIKNFDDLYNAHFDIGVHDVSYNRFYFLEPNERTNEYWRYKIYREKILKKGEDKFFLPLDKGIELMHTTFFGFQSQISSAHYLINKIFTQDQKCTVRYVKTIYLVDTPYLATQKNSSYINHYGIGMRRMFEHGLHRRAFVRLFTVKLPCEGNVISYFSGIGIDDTRFVFEIFIAGMLTSLVILTVEILASRFRNSARYFELLRKVKMIYPYTE